MTTPALLLLGLLLATPGALLVERKGAFALGRCIADEAELLTIAVDPDSRRRGIGRVCLLEFEQVAHAAGARTAFLEVAANNVAAIALYRVTGWENIGIRRGYYLDAAKNRFDALVMRKPLVGA